MLGFLPADVQSFNYDSEVFDEDQIQNIVISLAAPGGGSSKAKISSRCLKWRPLTSSKIFIRYFRVTVISCAAPWPTMEVSAAADL